MDLGLLDQDLSIEAKFEEWWSNYHPKRRVDRKKCLDKFKKINPDKEKFSYMIRVLRYHIIEEWAMREVGMIPRPLTYLNQGYFEIKLDTDINYGPMVYYPRHESD